MEIEKNVKEKEEKTREVVVGTEAWEKNAGEAFERLAHDGLEEEEEEEE